MCVHRWPIGVVSRRDGKITHNNLYLYPNFISIGEYLLWLKLKILCHSIEKTKAKKRKDNSDFYLIWIQWKQKPKIRMTTIKLFWNRLFCDITNRISFFLKKNMHVIEKHSVSIWDKRKPKFWVGSPSWLKKERHMNKKCCADCQKKKKKQNPHKFNVKFYQQHQQLWLKTIRVLLQSKSSR